MTTDDQGRYWERRAAQERQAAERAVSSQTRSIHLELAARCAERIAAEREGTGSAPIRPASA